MNKYNTSTEEEMEIARQNIEEHVKRLNNLKYYNAKRLRSSDKVILVLIITLIIYFLGMIF